MAKLIDLEELDSELERTRSRFEAWAKNRVSVATECKTNHAYSMQDANSKIAGLENRYLQLKGAAEQVRQRLAAESSEAAELTEAAAALHADRESLQARLSALNKALTDELSALRQREEQFTSSAEKRRKKLHALDQALHFYQSRLGLEFRQGEDELQLLLTQVRNPIIWSCRALHSFEWFHLLSFPAIRNTQRAAHAASCYVFSFPSTASNGKY